MLPVMPMLSQAPMDDFSIVGATVKSSHNHRLYIVLYLTFPLLIPHYPFVLHVYLSIRIYRYISIFITLSSQERTSPPPSLPCTWHRGTKPNMRCKLSLSTLTYIVPLSSLRVCFYSICILQSTNHNTLREHVSGLAG